MKREASPTRPDFAEEARAIGFQYASVGGEIYWDESVRYVFTLSQIENHIESATEDLHKLCLTLVARVASDERLLARLKIPPHAFSLIAESWRRRDPSLYGRFDFSYDGRHPPKLLEYNADTPTSLYEAAVVQWRWLEQLVARGDLPAGADQFNSLHERLVARWGEMGASAPLHLACMMQSLEDRGNLAYIQDCAMQESMGAIADRSHERLGASDLAIVEFRRQMVEAAKDFAQTGKAIGAHEGRVPHGKLQSFEGIVAKGYDWRTLGCSAEELAWNAAQQAEASAAE